MRSVFPFLLIFLILFNFFCFVAYQVYAIDIATSYLAIKLFGSLLVAAGVTFYVGSHIEDIYRIWKDSPFAKVEELYSTARVAAIKGIKAKVSDSLWTSVRDFAQSTFETGFHTEVNVSDGGNTDDIIDLSSFSGVYERDIYVSPSGYGSYWFFKIDVNTVSSFAGYRIDTADGNKVYDPSGRILINPALEFGDNYWELYWAVSYEPDFDVDAEIRITFEGAVSKTIATVPVISSTSTNLVLDFSGVSSPAESLPIPYVGHDVLENPSWDFEQENTREIAFPYLGGFSDVSDSNVERIIEESDTNDIYLGTDLERLSNVGYSDVIGSSVDEILEKDGVPIPVKGFLTGSLDLTPVMNRLGVLENMISGINSAIGGIVSTIQNIFVIDESMTIDFTPLQNINLKNKFPFSIPFDFANAIKSLKHDPQAPSWDIELLGNKFTIDFVVFEPWAKVVRWGILIVFNFSLILVTREIIKG